MDSRFIYHYLGAPRPVGILRECCCGIDTSEIADAIINAIGNITCSCDCVIDKIEEAKEEVLDALQDTCHCHWEDSEPCHNTCGIVTADGELETMDINSLCCGCFCRN